VSPHRKLLRLLRDCSPGLCLASALIGFAVYGFFEYLALSLVFIRFGFRQASMETLNTQMVMGITTPHKGSASAPGADLEHTPVPKLAETPKFTPSPVAKANSYANPTQPGAAAPDKVAPGTAPPAQASPASVNSASPGTAVPPKVLGAAPTAQALPAGANSASPGIAVPPKVLGAAPPAQAAPAGANSASPGAAVPATVPGAAPPAKSPGAAAAGAVPANAGAVPAKALGMVPAKAIGSEPAVPVKKEMIVPNSAADGQDLTPITVANFRSHYMQMRRICENDSPKVLVTQAVVEAYAAGGQSRASLFQKFVVNNNDLQKICFDVMKVMLIDLACVDCMPHVFIYLHTSA